MSDSNGENNSDSSVFNSYGNCEYFYVAEFNELKNKPSGLSLFALNCRSLNAHWHDLTELLCSIMHVNFHFDVIGLSETFTIGQTIDYSLEGYHKPIFKCRDEHDDGHGGIGMYIRENIQFKIRDDISVFIPHVMESLFVEINTNKNKTTIILGMIYRPNTAPRADMDIFMSTLNDINEIISKEKKTSYLMGDFNIDLLKFTAHQKTNAFLNSMLIHGHIPLITKPTRITRQTATLIYHIYSNTSNNNITTGIITTDLSDHFATFIFSNDQISHTTQRSRTIRVHKQENIAALKNKLANTDFSSVIECNSPDESYNTFINLYQKAYNSACPEKLIKLSKKVLKREPWITSGIITSSKRKQKLYQTKLKHPNDINDANYQEYCRAFNKIRRAAKSHYYSEMLHKYRNNTKKTWSILNKVIRKQNDKSSLPDTFKINNQNESNPQIISNEFNTFFSTIGSKYGDNIPDVPYPSTLDHISAEIIQIHFSWFPQIPRMSF